MGLQERLQNMLHNETFHHLALRQTLEETNLIGVKIEFDIGSSNDGRTQALVESGRSASGLLLGTRMMRSYDTVGIPLECSHDLLSNISQLAKITEDNIGC